MIRIVLLGFGHHPYVARSVFKVHSGEYNRLVYQESTRMVSRETAQNSHRWLYTTELAPTYWVKLLHSPGKFFLHRDGWGIATDRS